MCVWECASKDKEKDRHLFALTTQTIHVKKKQPSLCLFECKGQGNYQTLPLPKRFSITEGACSEIVQYTHTHSCPLSLTEPPN